MRGREPLAQTASSEMRAIKCKCVSVQVHVQVWCGKLHLFVMLVRSWGVTSNPRLTTSTAGHEYNLTLEFFLGVVRAVLKIGIILLLHDYFCMTKQGCSFRVKMHGEDYSRHIYV